ncbi:MAG: TlpA family protein disulfide reductase [Myxococcales bacterium]|nr:TlpA family protein disulfide reductase [Myxococcales bacterium]
MKHDNPRDPLYPHALSLSSSFSSSFSSSHASAHASSRRAALLLSATLCAAACDRATRPDTTAPAVTAGAPAPDFSLEGRDGETITLSALAGKVVIVDFWASWCAPCKDAMPHLEALYRERRDAGLVIIGVNIDGERGDAARFLDQVPVSFPIAFDGERGAVATRWSPPKMPSSFVIGRDGQVARVFPGFQPGDEEALAETVAALLRP